MKLNIISDKLLFSTTLKKEISIKDLIKKLKLSNHLKKNPKEIKLLDEYQNILSEDDIIKIPEIPKIEKNNFSNKQPNSYTARKLYLIFHDKVKNKKYSTIEEFFDDKNEKNKFEIEDLIMKSTNAKNKLVWEKPQKDNKILERRINLIDELINGGLGNMIVDNVQPFNYSGPIIYQNQLSQFINILRPIVDIEFTDNEGGIFSESLRNENNNNLQNFVVDENLVNNLKEMGFAEEQCRRALIYSRNNISRATDLLLSDNLDYLPSEKYF